jgi:predicted kinase
MQSLIIIRGVTASGKSTIAKQYRNFAKKTIWLKVDSFKDFFDILDPEVLVFVHGASYTSLDYFFKEGFSVVMDGVFQNPDYVQQAVDIAKKHEIPYKVFQTKVSLQTLQERDRVREGVPEGCRKPLGDEEIAKIYKVIEDNPVIDAIPLDTEKLSVDECIDFINQQFE